MAVIPKHILPKEIKMSDTLKNKLEYYALKEDKESFIALANFAIKENLVTKEEIKQNSYCSEFLKEYNID